MDRWRRTSDGARDDPPERAPMLTRLRPHSRPPGCWSWRWRWPANLVSRVVVARRASPQRRQGRVRTSAAWQPVGTARVRLVDPLLPDRGALHPVRRRGDLPRASGPRKREVVHRGRESACSSSSRSFVFVGAARAWRWPTCGAREVSIGIAESRSERASGAKRASVATRLGRPRSTGARKNSLWPMPLGLSCCGIELMAMIGPKFDLARFGAEAARFSSAPVRPAHRGRHAYLEDGRGLPHDLRPDARAQVGHRHGRVLLLGRHVRLVRGGAGRGHAPARRRLRARLPAAAGRGDRRHHQAAAQDRTRDATDPQAARERGAVHRAGHRASSVRAPNKFAMPTSRGRGHASSLRHLGLAAKRETTRGPTTRDAPRSRLRHADPANQAVALEDDRAIRWRALGDVPFEEREAAERHARRSTSRVPPRARRSRA